ncbi:MAG: hypothetical protein ACXWKW_08240 [Asticcacaulis sp.]
MRSKARAQTLLFMARVMWGGFGMISIIHAICAIYKYGRHLGILRRRRPTYHSSPTFPAAASEDAISFRAAKPATETGWVGEGFTFSQGFIQNSPA